MFIYTVFCFIIYTFTVSGLLVYHAILLSFPFPFFFFIMTERYICPKRSSVIYCEVKCYHVKCESSASCKLHSLSCINAYQCQICITDVYFTHTCMLACEFIYWKKMEMHRKKMSLFNVHVYFWFCLQFSVTDQRDFLERSSMFCDMV